MSQTPGYPPPGAYFSPPPFLPMPQRTSGLAIAALIVGILGLPSCCVPLFAGLAVVFGVAALPGIRRGEVSGRGLAITGIVLGSLGILLAAGFWIMFALAPKPTLLAGPEVTPQQQTDLTNAGLLPPGETVEWLQVLSPVTVRTGGVLLTDRRLVEYTAGRASRSIDLRTIALINRTPAGFLWFMTDAYEIKLDDGSKFTFVLVGQDAGKSDAFEARLRELVGRLRGQPPATGAADGEPEDLRRRPGGNGAVQTRPDRSRANDAEDASAQGHSP